MKGRTLRWVVASGVVVLVGACVLKTETVSGPEGKDGPPGEVGPPGKDGVPDAAAIADLQQEINALQTQVAALQQVDPDCPAGYARDASEPSHSPPPVHCTRATGQDKVVKVGSSGSAFWIDQYEASVWEMPNGTVPQYGVMGADYPPSFPQNGQWTAPVYALSVPGVTPSAYITWFQANEACRASGKRLPTGDEWLAAARGTPDPGDSPGDGGKCVTDAASPRPTGGGTACRSAWGAEDMIGNVTEWTAEWYAGLGSLASLEQKDAWLYGNGDQTFNIASSAIIDSTQAPYPNIPAAADRGGSRVNASGAGIFMIGLDAAPSCVIDVIGFRCVIPR